MAHGLWPERIHPALLANRYQPIAIGPPLTEFDVPPETPLSATIIIPQYNQPELTIDAIQSLRRTDPLRWPVLIVDNGSTPESLRRLHSISDPDTVIHAIPRQGLTAAWNAAASRCRTRHLLFLNNDTLSKGPWVESLLAPLLTGQAAITGVALRREKRLSPAIEILAGWCFAVRSDFFQAMGGFDEALSLYFSDTDFQLRMRDHYIASAITPWKVVPQLPIQHLSHRTARQLANRSAIWKADLARFLARWQGGC